MIRRHPSARRSASGRRITVVVSGAAGRLAIDLRRAARHTLQRCDRGSGRLEIRVVDDAEMRRLHRRWAGVNGTTDVLTFDLSEPTEPLDGALVVCRDEAARQAGRRGLTVPAELALYVVHGCLHLAGFDDRRPADFRRMHRQEALMLAELGLGDVFAAPVRGRRPR